MELVKDEINVEVVGKEVQVTRVVVEKFDAAEYLRRLQQLDQQKENGAKQVEDITKMAVSYGSQQAAAEVIAKEQEELAKVEREKALAEQNKQNELAEAAKAE